MSRLPCDGHGQQARGRLLGFYGTLVKDGKRYGTYRRFCTDCMNRILADHRKDWLPGGLAGQAVMSDCCTSCGEVVGEMSALRPFYATCYVRSDQRVDYNALYCDSCADMLVHGLSLTEKPNDR